MPCIPFLVACLPTMTPSMAQEANAQAVAPLTNIAQVRCLSPVEAARQLPVKLTATVTALNPSSVFIQDSTAGTFINFKSNTPSVLPGTVLEVEGVSYPGRFVPGITLAQIRILGTTNLPAAIPANFDELLSARWHYQRVQVDGIIRSIQHLPDRERFLLKLASGRRRLEVQLVARGITNLPALVDARVRLTGLAAGYINDWRQLITPQLLVSRLEDLQIETPPSSEPFEMPLTPFSSLLNFHPDGVSNHRVRVRGVVTHRQSGEAIFLRDGEHGLLVQTTQADPAGPGAIVEAIGFPAMGRFSAFLEDAEFRVIGRQNDPQPLPITIAQALTGTNEANLITLDAQVLEVLENPEETVLLLRSENTVFRALLPRTAIEIRSGSQVRLVGVCRVPEPAFSGTSFAATPQTIELLLRTPEDIRVISAPPWWTAQRLAIAVSVLFGLATVASIWIALLRRRVAEQAVVIRDKVHREAALEERHRMAREIHDTLAQSFSGLGFQLEALNARLPADAQAARTQLELARQMVRHGQEGFRRSLMNLRAQELERGSFTDALPELARQITAGTGIELRSEIQRPPRALPEAVESNLLRICQECLANAVHHGHPKRIHVSLSHDPDNILLRIHDDGQGFDVLKLNQTANGHFGWRGIRERAEQIRAKVELLSRPGSGTSVTISVPL